MEHPGLLRCEELWFEDGTVVLQAEDMLFRVYSGILARNSAFFAGLFQLPQPADAETYEGCPLVVLQGDSVRATRRFLLALHDRNHASSYLESASMVVDLLEMSSKYQADELKADVLKAVEPYFPTTLEGWRQSCWANTGDMSIAPFSDPYDLAEVAETFRLHARRLLPAATVVLSIIVMRSAAFEEVVHLLGDTKRDFNCNMRLAVLSGRFRLSQQARTVIYPSVFENRRCARAARCGAAKISIIEQIEGEDGCIYPFFVRPIVARDDLCASCGEVFDRDQEQGFRKVWDDLPKSFGLLGWNELLRDETA